MSFQDDLAIVLWRETGYKQKPGGPYTRTADGRIWVVDRAVLVKPNAARDNPKDQPIELPRRPDGCAFDDDPDDTGGRTCMGLLQREYNPFRRLRGLAEQDVWKITDAEVDTLYRQQYWGVMGCDALPDGLRLAVFDCGVHCGVGTAAKCLQRALGVKVDGHIGVTTLNAVRTSDAGELIARFSNERRAYLRACKTFWKHGKGWLARVTAIADLALAQVKAAKAAKEARPSIIVTAPTASVPSVVPPDLDPVEVTSPARATLPPEPQTALASTTVVTASGLSLSGILLMVKAGATAVKAALITGAFDLTTFVLEVLTNDAMVDGLVGLVVAIGSIYVLRERIRKLNPWRAA